MVAAASWLSAYPAWTSPLTNHFGGSDCSVFMGALFGGTAYWLLTRKSVPAQADASSMDEPTAAQLAEIA
jgi:hypothetical protein